MANDSALQTQLKVCNIPYTSLIQFLIQGISELSIGHGTFSPYLIMILIQAVEVEDILPSRGSWTHNRFGFPTITGVL